MRLVNRPAIGANTTFAPENALTATPRTGDVPLLGRVHAVTLGDVMLVASRLSRYGARDGKAIAYVTAVIYETHTTLEAPVMDSRTM